LVGLTVAIQRVRGHFPLALQPHVNDIPGSEVKVFARNQNAQLTRRAEVLPQELQSFHPRVAPPRPP
jgi:hypothetical protein